MQCLDNDPVPPPHTQAPVQSVPPPLPATHTHRPQYVYDFTRAYPGVAGLPPLLEALRHDPAFVSLNLSGTGLSDCNCAALKALLEVGLPEGLSRADFLGSPGPTGHQENSVKSCGAGRGGGKL